jgi:hypothetical protein
VEVDTKIQLHNDIRKKNIEASRGSFGSMVDLTLGASLWITALL